MSSGEILRFDCGLCGHRTAAPRAPEWSSETAWVDCITWLADRGRARRTDPPVCGEAVVLQVRHPFLVAAGARFSAIFQPPEAAIDGWVDHPSSLLRSAWVSLRAERWRVDGERAHLTATVLAVRPFGELPAAALGAPRVDDELVVPCWPAGSADRVVIGDLELIDGSAQGDVGGWVVCRGDVVWVYGRWGFHEDAAFLGPAHLTPAARARLDAACGAGVEPP